MLLIIAVPTEIPVTVPAGETTVATLTLLLLHVPVGKLVKVIFEPTHTVCGAATAEGVVLTSTIVDFAQPVGMM
jgi:hypothetical protein